MVLYKSAHAISRALALSVLTNQSADVPAGIRSHAIRPFRILTIASIFPRGKQRNKRKRD